MPPQLQQVAICFAFTGKPAANTNLNVAVPWALTLPSGLVGSVIYDVTVPTANAVFQLYKITSGVGGVRTNIGTITITTASRTSCTLASAGTSLAIGDTLQLVTPNTQDATLADVGITVLCMRV